MVTDRFSKSPARVAIIGAGPSGNTVASLLAKKGISAVVFDDGVRPALIVGESLIPQMVPIFQRLGIEDRIAKIGVYKPGATVTFDPENHVRLSFEAVRGVLPTYAYNVPRKEFDGVIAQTAAEAGVRTIHATAKVEAVESGNSAVPSVRLSEETIALVPEWEGKQPDFVVDASGRRRIFAKLLGIGAKVGPRKDVAHFAHYENCPWPEPVGHIYTIRLEYGWSWRIPLPGPKNSLGVVINKEHVKRYGETPEEQLEAIIENEPRLRTDCKDRRRVTPVATYSNYQLISDRGFGPNWAMVGDAFGFVDPMLSSGLGMAMLSAEQVADVLVAGIGSPQKLEKGMTRYIKWFREHLAGWQDLVNHFYDGRLFAMKMSGMKFEAEYPGKLTDIMHRHVEKNISSMASGAYVCRPYSRWLLHVLGRYFLQGVDPKDFAIR